MIVYLRFSTKA